MVNTTEFIQRLQKVIDYYGLTASAFADELDIQRSSISHLLSERNKPSLDFILKLVERFPEVDMYWITQGKGSFPAVQTQKNNEISKNQTVQTNLFGEEVPEIQIEKPKNETNSIKVSEIKKEIPIESTEVSKKTALNVKKIIFFYEDNSFEVFQNA